MIRSTRRFMTAYLAAMFLITPPLASGESQDKSADNVEARRISRLVDGLGAADYGRRVQAARDLITAGPAALPALREAVKGDDYEVAATARELVELLGELLFGGVSIELRASRTKIDWSDPFALTVRMTNSTQAKARVPVVLEPPDDAIRRVTDLLDLSDFLVVTCPNGEPLDLYVDDVNEDEAIMHAVEARVDQPPVSLVDPGRTVTYTVRDFNRDFARYRMLQAGTYRIQVVYQPQWSDEAFTRARVGRVESNAVSVTVSKPAPKIVREAIRESSLIVTREGNQAVARLVNQLDVPVWVNMNVVDGAAAAPFARFRWHLTSGHRSEPLHDDASTPPATKFSRALLKTVQPGESIVLGRLSLDELRRGRSADDSAQQGLVAEYSNLTCRAWQRMFGVGWLGKNTAPEAFRTMLPHRMLIARHKSAPLFLDRSE